MLISRFIELLFSRLHRPAFLLSTVLLVAVIPLVGYEFVEGFEYESNETTNIWLRISHANAAVLLVLLCLLWLPVLNSLLRRARSSRWARYQILNEKRLHRWIGYLLVIFTLGHGASQLQYYTTLDIPFTDALLGTESDLVRSMRSTMYEFVTEDESIDVVDQWVKAGRTEAMFHKQIRPIMKDDCTKCHSTTSTQTYAIQSLPLVTYDEVVSLSYSGIQSRQFRINVTGLLLFVLFMLIGVTSIPVVRKRVYHHFESLHRLGYWSLPLLLLHVPQWYWLAPVGVLLIWDWSVQRLSVQHYCKGELKRLDEQTIKLVVSTNFKQAIHAGDYVKVRIPVVSKTEWHAFSIVSYDEGLLTLKINVAGDWTRKLMALGDYVECILSLRGPYSSPASQSRHSKKRLLIAGGIGITPYWHWLNAEYCVNTQLIWVVKDIDRLEWLKPVLLEKERSEIFIYITQGENAELPKWLEGLNGVDIKIGRPCWMTLAEAFSTAEVGDCYLCGPKAMMAEAGKSFRRYRWHVFKESF
ncbi:NADPH oxidase family protein [Neptuniibacter sp. QD72_48]|uniref:NADPH oxidase family protein n=1 Tax=unclassified Neptuniibacter TaxID=2630693 RepID=UPI0039F49AF1